MSGIIPPVSSAVEIDDSCNNCCAGCFPSRPARQPQRHKPLTSKPELVGKDISTENLKDADLKAHKVSAPVLSESGNWEVEIDGVKHPIK